MNLEDKKFYLDTNIWRAAGWPNLSAKLRAFIELTASLGVTVYLPHPVELELEKFWMTDILDAINAANSKINAIAKDVGQIGIVSKPQDFPGEQNLRTKYRAYVSKLKSDWAIHSVPITKRGVDELFDLACRYHPPFEPTDKGFKDTVIYLSVIDHIKESGDPTGSLIASDSIYIRRPRYRT